MLSYTSQRVDAVFGTKSAAHSRTSVALTSDYADTAKVLETGGFSRLNLDVLYTMGATETSNSIELKFECSSDRTNFYRVPNEAVSGGTSTLTAREFTFVGTNAAAATISIGLDVSYKFMKISVKETGVATNAGTIFAEATLSGQ